MDRNYERLVKKKKVCEGLKAKLPELKFIRVGSKHQCSCFKDVLRWQKDGNCLDRMLVAGTCCILRRCSVKLAVAGSYWNSG